MDDGTRNLIRYGLTGSLALFGILFFFQTRDPMVLIFAVVAGAFLNLSLGRFGRWRPGAAQVRVRCRSCSALNLEDAKFCSQCGRGI